MIERAPLVGSLARRVKRMLDRATFPGSKVYWETRYATGGTSGSGSYGRLAEFKAEILNSFVRQHDVRSAIEFGCGDGNQLSLIDYPSYLGLDVSETVIRKCEKRFEHDDRKTFAVYHPDRFVARESLHADLGLSLDVIYHLIEDEAFVTHLRHLFCVSERYVIIYSSDTDAAPTGPRAVHLRNRRFSEWIETNVAGWKLLRRVPNRYPYHGNELEGSIADFFVYEKAIS
jgi:hypothetical protein